MADERGPGRGSDYRAARIGSAAALTVTLALLLLFDALSIDYEVSTTVLGVVPSMILILLGIEIAALFRR